MKMKMNIIILIIIIIVIIIVMMNIMPTAKIINVLITVITNNITKFSVLKQIPPHGRPGTMHSPPY